jgi:hypothetical protein
VKYSVRRQFIIIADLYAITLVYLDIVRTLAKSMVMA